MVISTSELPNYLTRISNGIDTFQSDVLIEKGGKGESFRPHELLCAAVASCMNISIRMVLERLNIRYDKITIAVELDTKEEKTNFIYHIDIEGDVTEKEKQEVIRLAENCPVRKTLLKEINFIRN